MGGIPIHERFLRYLWFRRSFRSSELRTSDGRIVEILNPGKFIDGAGPDVREAVIRIESTTLSGDVEFHQEPSGWRQHNHHLKPSYNRVILHVVLNHDHSHGDAVTRSGRLIPLLVVAPFLSDSIDTLWNDYVNDEKTASSLACFGRTRTLPEQTIRRWLERVDIERLELRILRFKERLLELVIDSNRRLAEPRREYDTPRAEDYPEEIPAPYPELSRTLLTDRRLWEQVLYESVLEGLGYSRNRVPFIRLARIASLGFIRSMSLQNDPAGLSALLYGVSGLLPTVRSLKQKPSRVYVGSLLREWNLFRKSTAIERMHPAEWQFSPTRPHNFPTIRISAASGIVRKILLDELFRGLIQVIKSNHTNREKLKHVQDLFLLEPEEYWVHHYNFDRPAKRPNRVLGMSRINDILANTVFPLLLLYARVFRDSSVRRGIHSLRADFLPLSDNSSTRVMSRELFNGKKALTSLPLQQGAIQLYRYYCTKNRCNECEIGKRVFGES